MPGLPPPTKAALYFRVKVPVGYFAVVRHIKWTVYPIPADAFNGVDPALGPVFHAWINQSAPGGYAALVAQNGRVANLDGIAVGYIGMLDDLELIVPQSFSLGVALLLPNWANTNPVLNPYFRLQGWLVPYTGRPSGFELANECGVCGDAGTARIPAPVPAPAAAKVVPAVVVAAAPLAPAGPMIPMPVRQGDVVGLCRMAVGNPGSPADPHGFRNQKCTTTAWGWERQNMAWPTIVARVRAGTF